MFKAVVLSVLLGVSLPVLAEDAQRFDIPSQDLASSLNKFAVAADWQIVFAPELVRDIKAPKLEGSFTKEEAIRRLLEGSGLEYRFMGAGTVAVSKLGEGVDRTSADVGMVGELRVAQGNTSSVDSGASASGQGSEEKQDTPNAEENSGVKLEEVVVTAQKRKESLQDVPISIAVLSGEQLDSSRVQGISEALSRVPGVSMEENQQGGGTQLSIRGVTTRALLAGSSPIGYYVDTIPFGFSRHAIAPDANAYDLERVEVLRGPQGTLYGAGGMGGVVRVLTHDADLGGFDFKARTSLSGTEGGDESWRADTAVNIPLIEDKLAVRAVAGYNNVGGWVESPSRQNINDGQLENYRVRLRAQPTDRLSVGLSSWVSRSDFDALALSNDNGKFNSDLRQPTSMDFEAYGADVTYEFPSFSITSRTGYIDFSNITDQDIDWAIGRPPASPNTLSLLTDLDSRVLSEEIVLNSATGDSLWEWSAGLFYRDEESLIVQRVTFQGIPFVPQEVTNTSTQYAVFGELHRWLIRDQLKVTAGLRYFNDDTEYSGRQADGQPFTGNWDGSPMSASYHKLTPRVVLTWLSGDDLTLYASYGQGFRSGLLSTDFVYPPAEPDTLTNYEIGTKGNLLDGRVSFDLALYFTDWQDIQQNITRTCLLVSIPIPCAVVDNAGSASGPGVDLALSFRPVDRLSLGVGLGWNDLKYDDDVIDDTGFVQYVGGARIQDSPEYTANASADYVIPLGGSGLEGRFSGSANYTSSRISPTFAGPQASNSLLIANAGFSIESPDDHWTATFFAENINNERDGVSVGLTPEWAQRKRPRTFGVQVEYRFGN